MVAGYAIGEIGLNVTPIGLETAPFVPRLATLVDESM
jgi:hypothetical protein